MAEMKTKVNDASVDAFLAKSDDDTRRDCYRAMAIMETVTGEQPKMWGTAIVGFGQYHYKYESGREGDMCMIGLSPRVGKITLYVLSPGEEQVSLLEQLGKYKAGKGCLYIKKMDDVDPNVLEKLMRRTIAYLKEKYEG